MPHFGFEAYRQGFFGELLHGRGRILAVGMESIEKMTKSSRFATVCRLCRHPRRRAWRPEATLGGMAEVFENMRFYHGVVSPLQFAAAPKASRAFSLLPEKCAAIVGRSTKDSARQGVSACRAKWLRSNKTCSKPKSKG
jgi:hypothetical protein